MAAPVKKVKAKIPTPKVDPARKKAPSTQGADMKARINNLNKRGQSYRTGKPIGKTIGTPVRKSSTGTSSTATATKSGGAKSGGAKINDLMTMPTPPPTVALPQVEPAYGDAPILPTSSRISTKQAASPAASHDYRANRKGATW